MLDEFIRQAGDFIFMDDEPEKADVIFLPGNGYPQMAERAAELYKAGYAPYIIPSGKYSITLGHFIGVLAHEDRYPGPYETEADFLSDVLQRNGVPKEAILPEREATYTYENALKTKEILDAKGITVNKAILCCKTHHARRAYMYYQTVFPEAKILVCPADADGITRTNWTESNEGIDAVTGEITRVIRQFSLMMK
ncbi:MAG: YdcF family protein [Clostridiales bacterium]|nr:YdcF family protein [Candidatus Blautia equi]